MEKKSMGQFIAALRKSNGMTQQELANQLNVSNKTISKWERSERFPEISLIPAIAELFNVTSDEILKGERILNNNNSNLATTKIKENINQIIQTQLVKFKNISFISFALIIIGVICLYTVSYTLYKPGIGFGIFLIFAVSAGIIGIMQLNNASLIINGNTGMKLDDAKIFDFRKTVYTYSFFSFIAISTSLIFSLPLIYARNVSFTNSVISIESYLSRIPILIMFSFVVIALGYNILIKKTETKSLLATFPEPFRKEIIKLNKHQGVLYTIAFILALISSTLKYNKIIDNTFGILFIIIIIISILFHKRYKIKNIKNKLIVLVISLRNFLYLITLFFLIGNTNQFKSGCILLLITFLYIIVKNKLAKKIVI